MKKLFLLLSIALILSSCHNNDEPTPVAISRTVLVYMVADNSLTANVEANVDSMMLGFKNTSNVGNLIIYLDDANKTPVLFKLKKNNDGSVSKEVIKNYSEQNSLDVSVMKGIFSDVYSSYPADSYGLILWSHGYSWLPSPSTKTISMQWFGQDNSSKSQGDSNSFMDIPDLAEALKATPYLDFLIFDACYMSSVEVAYELKDRAEYLIVAPNEILDSGMPYKEIIKPIFSAEKNYKDIPYQFFYFYNSVNAEHRLNSSIAMIKCSEISNLAAATKKIIAAHPSEFSTIVPGSIQLYDRETYANHFAYDFGQLIEDIATPEEWTSFQKQLNATVVYKYATNFTGPYLPSDPKNSGAELPIDPNHFSGLGAYIPKASQTTYISFFKTLSWFNASGWNQTAWGTN